MKMKLRSIYKIRKLFLGFLLISCLILASVEAQDIPPAMVSVIVDGRDANHLREVINEARRLSSKVPVRNVLTIFSMPLPEKLPKPNEPLDPQEQAKFAQSSLTLKNNMDIVKSFGLQNIEAESDLTAIKNMKISYSPTWVVRYKGENYIYEGFQSIDNYFTSNGTFKEGN